MPPEKNNSQECRFELAKLNCKFYELHKFCVTYDEPVEMMMIFICFILWWYMLMGKKHVHVILHHDVQNTFCGKSQGEKKLNIFLLHSTRRRLNYHNTKCTVNISESVCWVLQHQQKQPCLISLSLFPLHTFSIFCELCHVWIVVP